MFKGSYVALVTPFKNNAIDEKKIQDLVEWHINEGTNGLVPVGTTGETPTLTHEEHARVVGLVIKAARKRVPVIAGAGSNSTQEAISLTKEAKEMGADAVLSVTPYYNKPSQEGLIAHFSAIANAVDIPIMLYNIPSRTGVKLSAETIETIAKKNKTVVGVKEATGDMELAADIIKRLGKSFCVMSGDDSNTLALMALGATGVISVAANIVPKAIANLCKTQSQGEHEKLMPLVKALFLETNPAPVKAAMAELGLIDDGSLRLPLVTIKEENRKKLKEALKNYGVQVLSISK